MLLQAMKQLFQSFTECLSTGSSVEDRLSLSISLSLSDCWCRTWPETHGTPLAVLKSPVDSPLLDSVILPSREQLFVSVRSFIEDRLYQHFPTHCLHFEATMVAWRCSD